METKSNSKRSKTGQIEQQLSSSSRVYYFANTHESLHTQAYHEYLPDNTRVDYSSHVGESLATSTNLLTLHVACLLEVQQKPLNYEYLHILDTQW